MTDPVDESADVPTESPGGRSVESEPSEGGPGSQLSRLADILEQFKAGSSRADTDRVNDRATGGSRLSWEPVTDDTATEAPPTPPPAEQPSSFQFDLGSALQRLGAPTDFPRPEPEPLTQRTSAGPEPSPLPNPQSVTEAPLADLPVRTRGAARTTAHPVPSQPEPLAQRTVAEPPVSPPAARVEQPAPQVEAPSKRVPPVGSVFDAVAPAPALPAQPRAAAAPAPALPAQPRAAAPSSPTLPPQQQEVAPTVPSAAPSFPAGALPTLPPSNPAAPPPVVAPIETAPSTPDLNALRSAQLRAKKNQRKGKLLARSLLAFVLIGVVAGGALIFGRDYLFATDWDRALTPVVDEIQIQRGTEFDHPVALITEPADGYARVVTDLVLGADWQDRLPEWRALGLVGGEATEASISAAVATNVPAVYDPASDAIYRLAGAETGPSLRYALEEAFIAQAGVAPPAADETVGDPTDPGLLGTDSVEQTVRRAVDSATIEASGGDPVFGVSPESGLPLPIVYELQAGRDLGVALLATADLAPNMLEFGDPYPSGLVGALDDGATRSAPAALRPGDIAAQAPIALGADDWGLVWGARLPVSAVDRMTAVLQSDSYRTFTRGSSSCFVAVFETDTEARGTLLFTSLLGWSSGSPTTAQAVTTQLGPTRVQLEACDPGATAPVPDEGSVEALITRQLARLTS